jgi:putative membrane protein
MHGFGGYGPGFGMMGGWGGGIFPFSGIFGLLFLVLVVVALVWFVRALLRSRERLPQTGRHPAGLDLLDQRYARGEINRDEYLQKRADVLG